jgi:hypothetical protein
MAVWGAGVSECVCVAAHVCVCSCVLMRVFLRAHACVLSVTAFNCVS